MGVMILVAYILFFFRESVLCLIPGKALGEGCAFVKFTGFQCIEIFMGLQLALSYLQHFNCHIGAVVSRRESSSSSF